MKTIFPGVALKGVLGLFTVNTTNWVTVVAFELLSMTIVGFTPAPRPAGFAVSVKVAGVVPLVGATVSHAAY